MHWYLFFSTLGQQLYISVPGWGQAERSSSEEERKKRQCRKKGKLPELFSPVALLQQTSPLNLLQVTLCLLGCLLCIDPLRGQHIPE